jgi:hypothetical protein
MIIGTVVVALLVAVVVLLAVAATRPDAFRIERTANIHAPAQRIFPLINDFHNWGSWSPWEKLDPALRRTYSGANRGLGAIYEWEGNKQVGKGRMEITESSPDAKILIKLDFLQPFEAHNTAEFHLQQRGEGTSITWAMSGNRPFMFKVMSLFMNMDNMIGKDFEAGLANMKGLAEKPTATAAV